MGKIEKAHRPLRRVLRQLKQNHLSLSNALCLRYEIKTLNDSAADKGLVPYLLVFRVMPSIGNRDANLSDQRVCFRSMKTAREETSAITAERRTANALNTNVPPSAGYSFRIGQTVIAFNEKQCKWVPEFKVIKLANKIAWVNNGTRI